MRRTRSLTLLALLALAAPGAKATPPDPGQQGLRARAEAGVRRLEAQHPRVRVTWRADRATPTLLTRMSVPTAQRDARRAAESFLSAWPELVQVPAGELTHAATVETRDRTAVRFEQRWQGLPVRGREVIVTVDSQGTVLAVAIEAQPLARVIPASLDADAACAIARGAVGEHVAASPDALGCGDVRQIVAASGDHGVVAYEVQVTGTPVLADWVVLVDGSTGAPFGLHDRLVR